MEIREFTLADYPRVLELWNSVEGLSINEEDTPEAISAFLQRNPGLSFVAQDADDRVVATVLCGHNGRQGQIYHLAVAEAHRREGLAKVLVDRCFARLRDLGMVRCNIFVYSNNDVATGFWRATGWKAPATWMVMQKRLVPRP